MRGPDDKGGAPPRPIHSDAAPPSPFILGGIGVEDAQGLRIKIAESHGLKLVGQSPRQQALGQRLGKAATEEISPFDAERLDIERFEALDTRLEALGACWGQKRSGHGSGRLVFGR